MAVEIISWPISTKEWDRSGSNSQSLDLQSNSLQTALWDLVDQAYETHIFILEMQVLSDKHILITHEPFEINIDKNFIST